MSNELVALLLTLFFSLGAILDGSSESGMVAFEPPEPEIGAGIEPGG